MAQRPLESKNPTDTQKRRSLDSPGNGAYAISTTTTPQKHNVPGVR
ncbi:hypothetical protein QP940_08425 [Corynebacterium pseudodiphtheriticum]|nr:hypothetical protein [Corynebacterium pseudodiphtheriticum]MDK8614782.1 hypothetical protein [Corynebacterium pseudodiphtheriticum]MDK8738721.1 hypothetical protein [Corynebacterium pseudodiphtheriticum]MDK8745263.1 hypothetical protein [Corynebacterium pseudodiphtheriticum]